MSAIRFSQTHPLRMLRGDTQIDDLYISVEAMLFPSSVLLWHPYTLHDVQYRQIVDRSSSDCCRCFG